MDTYSSTSKDDSVFGVHDSKIKASTRVDVMVLETDVETGTGDGAKPTEYLNRSAFSGLSAFGLAFAVL